MLSYLIGNVPSDSPTDSTKAEAFYYYQKSAIKSLLFAFLLAAVVETTAVHVLVAMWSHWAAWLLTLSSLWVVVTIVAQIRAIGQRPILLTAGSIILRNGMYELVTIPRATIVSIEKTNDLPVAEDGQPKPLHACFPATPNLLIRLTQPQTATLMYGVQRPFQTAAIFVDEPKRLMEKVMLKPATVTQE